MLVVIFIALREAVKGGQLRRRNYRVEMEKRAMEPERWDDKIKEELVYGDFQ